MKHFTLAQWLEGFVARCPRLRGVSVTSLLDMLERHGDDFGAWSTGAEGRSSHGEGTADDAWRILHALAHAGRHLDDWRAAAAWVRAFDYKDSDAWGALPDMMGLTWPELRRGGWSMGDDGVGDLLVRCNQLAAERRVDERFFSLRPHGDNYVIVMLSPAVAERLVAAELLDLDLRPPPVFREDPLWRLKSGPFREHADLLLVLAVALLAIPTFFLFHDRALSLVPVFVAVMMLRDPIAKRVSWLRWMKR
jgi:hypothetical protein